MKLKKSILIFVLVLALTLSVLTPFAVAQYPSDDDYIFATFINIENNEQWANFTQNIATLGDSIAVNLLANVVDTSTSTFAIPGAVSLTILGNGNTVTFDGVAANTITLNSVNFAGATLVLNDVTIHRATQGGNILQVSNDSQVYLNNGAVVSGTLSTAGNASSTAINLLVGRATATINYGYLRNVIRGVTMANSARLHMYEGEILAENGIHFAGGSNVRAYLHGGTIRRLQTELAVGTGVHFNANGASHWDYGNSLFTMTDGEITGFREGIGFANNITGNHIRIYIHGGEIHGNRGTMANNPGGGVRLRSQVRFTMTGGAIRDNIANGNGAGLGPQPGGAAASIDLSRIYIGSDAVFFGNQANTLRIADQLALDNAETIRPGQVTYVRHPSGNVLNHAFNNHDISVLPAQESIIFPPTPRNPRILSEMLEQGNVLLNVSPGNLGIFAHHSPFVIPAGRTLYVQTVLNVQGDAELVIEGNVVVLPGGRINNQGGLGGTITIANGGRLVNNGHVENVTNSTVVNNGTIVNNNRFEIRAGTTFVNNGDVVGDSDLSIHRLAIVP